MSNVNYQCTVVKLGKVEKHPNADRLQITNIFGNTVIVGLDTKEGDIGLFFPIESQIGVEFAVANDLIRRKGEDGKPAGGIFSENRRVRCQKLRGVPSMGFFCPLHFLKGIPGVETEPKLGDSFNELDGVQICTKYVPRTNSKGRAHIPNIRKKHERYIKDQFKEHHDTENLFRNIDRVKDGDLLVYTWKLHGTSMRCGNVLVQRILSPLERLLRWFGVKIHETEYDFLIGSRTVIKDAKNAPNGYYEKDLWTEVSNSYFKDKLHKGEMIYAEIVGYVPGTQSLIQKGYTYGCEEGKCEVYVYRITQTNLDGVSIDLSWEAVKQRCLNLSVKHVPEIKQEIHQYMTHEMLEHHIKSTYLETGCHLQPEMPEEGICLRIEGLQPQILKAKSIRFLELETKQLDTGEMDLETAEAESSKEQTEQTEQTNG